MATVDVVSKLDLQAVDNAINSANRKLSQRYDFKGVEFEIELNKKDKSLRVVAPDEMKLKAIQETVVGTLQDQKVSPKVIDWGDREAASLGAIRLKCNLIEGLEKDVAKKITAMVKDSGLKVKASIQGEQVRLEGKKIDDLQAVMQLLREADLPVPVQFDNMKR
ncbi:MAG: YajQ family cyclic di-GMP-binding protein [Candidatus Sumerlaeia bacterium]|nr:YajQ family cyclic di-GMP-binding protein [Candidatus Sumerlaeia bacterium]